MALVQAGPSERNPEQTQYSNPWLEANVGLPKASTPTHRRYQEAWRVQKQGTGEVPVVALREVGRHCGTFNDD